MTKKDDPNHILNESAYLRMQEKKMTIEETELRDAINEELSTLGYHLRVGIIRLTVDSSMHEFVPPIDKWFGELPAVDQIVTEKIKDWQLR